MCPSFFYERGDNFPMSGRFNWLKMWMSLNIVFFLFSQVASSGQIQNVPVATNDSVITAKVLEYSILNSTLEGIEPEQIFYSLRVLVMSSKSIKGKANFTQSKVNQVIKVYSKDMLSPILFGKVIEANMLTSSINRLIQIFPTKNFAYLTGQIFLIRIILGLLIRSLWRYTP